MKRSLLVLMFIVSCLTSVSQISKIYTFENHPSAIFSGMVYEGDFWGDGYQFWEGNTFYVYNWDFTLSNSHTVSLIPEGYEFSSASFSRKCFNNDNKLELFVIYRSQDQSSQFPDINNREIAWIINEDNELIQDLGCAEWWSLGGFHKKENELRCFVTQCIVDEEGHYNYSYDIYRCAGNGGNYQINTIPTNNMKNMAYPNPANNFITLSYTLKSRQTSIIHIYDVQGRLIKTIPVGPHFDKVNLDVSSFPRGVYIYECDGVTNRFILE